MTQTTIRRSALILTSVLLATLLVAFALILSGPRPAQAQDVPGADAVPLASECFAEYQGDNDTDFASADHQAVQQAIDAASPGATIRIAGTCAGTSNRMGTDQTVYISKSLTLEGGYDETNWAGGSDPVANPTTLDALGGEHVITVTVAANDVTLRGLIIKGGSSTGDGGGVHSSGGLAVQNSTVWGNSALNGGGLHNQDGTLTVRDSTVRDNTASSQGGGGIYSTFSGTLTVDNSTVSGNTTTGPGGGGIRNLGVLSITNSSVISDNLVQAGFGFGGGIYNRGQATISGSDLISNTVTVGEGGGIYNSGGGTVELVNSTLYSNTAGYGGGLSSRGGTLTVTHSTIISNTAHPQLGGGIRAQDNARVTIHDSQIEGNQARLSGGGIHLIDFSRLTLTHSAVVSNTAQTIRGGGVYVRNLSSALIENATISGNRATGVQGVDSNKGNGGGIYLGGGPAGPAVLTVTHSTIAHNYAAGSGGGMDFNLANLGDNLTFRGTILTGNQAGVSHPDCYDYDTNSYTFASNAHNIFSGAAGDDCPVGASDLALSTSGQDIDDVLAPLAKNGGPTLNHALRPDSLAINAGENWLAVDTGGSPLETDQRGPGFPRIRLGTVDIGAYEYSDCDLPATVGDEDELNDAILCYNDQSAPGTYTITLGADIDLSSSPWPIDNATEGVALLLDGTGRTVDGQDTMGIQPFSISVSTTVQMEDITITGGHEPYDTTLEFIGGGLTNAGDLTLSSSRVTGNWGSSGGGIANLSTGKLAIANSLITDNHAFLNGGGIYNIEGSLTIDQSTIYSNSAAFSGGGIYVQDYARLTLMRSAVVSNTAETERGGGVYIRHGSRALIENTTISGNRAEGLNGTAGDMGNGGGIYVGFASPNHVTVTHSTIVDNYAAGEGGGMDFNRGATGDVLTFRGTILAGNRAGGAYQDCYDYITSNYTFSNDAHNLFSGATGDDCPVGTNDLSLQALGLTIGDVLELNLAGNGGDTLNHALLLGSVAQDAVPAASCTLPDDQRGVARPQGDDCDIGAHERDYYALTVLTAGAGSGAVASDLDGINCQPGGAECSASYAAGTLVTLTATPAAGSNFAGWSGACSGDAACAVTMDQAREVTATFDSTSSTVYLPYATK